MMIPSIDLMGGRAVQLKGGREHVLTSERDPVDLAREFHRYGEIAVIDLDAARGEGDNIETIRRILAVREARVGGGIRDQKRGEELLRAGASCLIVGTAATPEFLGAFLPERVMVALDHRGGEVVDSGWTRATGEGVAQRAQRLAPHCSGFLVTSVEDEGGMGGFDLAAAERLRDAIGLPLTVAGGVRDAADVIAITRAGMDAQVGMALYAGRLDPVAAVVGGVDFGKGILPTIVQDEQGRVLMLAHSTEASLTRALREGKGIYFSRSRGELWEKGATSGHTQELIACRLDCDRDAILFTVRQRGPACHRGSFGCFGRRRFSVADLYDVLAQRRRTMPEGSYSARLFRDRKLLLGKIREEAEEVATAAGRRELVWEIADLLFMLSALAVDEGLAWREIEAELGGRHR